MVKASSGGASSSAGELTVEQGLFGSSDCVLICREFAYDSWESISHGIRMRFSENLVLKPFCDNLAGILVKDGGLRKLLVDFGRGSLLGCSVNIQAWDYRTVVES